MRVHTICERRGSTALVGPGSLIGEFECVDCVAEQDAAYRAQSTPCCSAYATTCCGHDDVEPHLFYVEIVSADFCDNWPIPDGDVPF